MIEQHPLSENAQAILGNRALMKILMNPKNDTTGSLSSMCKDNKKLSKKMAKLHLKNINDEDMLSTLDAALKSLRSFMLIKDDLQQTRMDWIFGVPHTKRQAVEKKKQKFEYFGREAADYIGSRSCTYHQYVSPDDVHPPLCTMLFRLKRSRDVLACRIV